ncbi:MAG: YncE family protein, partial [Chloroflexota bacterium]
MSDREQNHIDERQGNRVRDVYRHLRLDDAQRARHRARLDEVIARKNTDRPGRQLGEIGAIAAVVFLAVSVIVVWQLVTSQPDNDESALAPSETVQTTTTPDSTTTPPPPTATPGPPQHEIDAAEALRESTIPYPPPETCTGATWFGPQQRVAADQESPEWRLAYYLYGSGISLGSRTGVFFTGENDIRWVHAETPLPQDTRYTLTRTDPSPATGEIAQHGESYTATSINNPDQELRIQEATLTFPEPGCWWIRAESDVSGFGLSVTAYVYPSEDRTDSLGASGGLYAVESDGEIRGIDLATGDDLFTIQGEEDTDIARSPAGDRLYVLHNEQLAALDARTGEELWHVAIEDRVAHILATGPQALNVSHRGDYVFVYSYLTEEPGHLWIQIFDADTGEKLRDTEGFG